VVNIGSMGGRLTFPGGGLYHATKYALEALSDAMRFEVKGFGVDVVLIEPGLITTEFANNALVAAQDGAENPYADFEAKVAVLTKGVYESPVRHLGGGPEVVAKAIEKAIGRRRAPTRVPVTASARLSIMQRRLTPDRLWDAAMRSQFPQPR
jgi:short-subunit dehydrogenase